MKSAEVPITAAPIATATTTRRERQRSGITSNTTGAAEWFQSDFCHPEYAPFPGDALEWMRAAVLEDNPRTGHQVLDRARGEHLTGAGQSSNARADVHGKAADVVAHPLALTGVDAGSDVEVGLEEPIADGDGAADSARGPIEGGQEPIAGGADLLSAKSRELATYQRVMLLEEVAPGMVTERCRALGGADDVGKEDGGEHPIGLGGRPDAGEELFDLVDHLALVANKRKVVRPGKLEEPGIRDSSRDVATLFDVRVEVTGAVEDERRHANRGKDVADVDLRVHPGERQRGAGTRRKPQVGGQPPPEARIVRQAGRQF